MDNETKKIALFAFNGDVMCFVHVLLNAIDMHENGYDVKVIMEGSATKQIAELDDTTKPFSNLYHKVKDLGLFDCVCKACASKMGALSAAQEQGLKICDDMSGHPSARRYFEQGYEILNF